MLVFTVDHPGQAFLVRPGGRMVSIASSPGRGRSFTSKRRTGPATAQAVRPAGAAEWHFGQSRRPGLCSAKLTFVSAVVGLRGKSSLQAEERSQSAATPGR